MDTLDVRILRLYIQGQTPFPITPDFRTSVTAIANALGEDDDIVRRRLKRIQGSGFISHNRLYINPSLWGGGHASARFEVEPIAPKEAILERLRLLPGITHVGVFYDSLVPLFDFEDEASLSRQVELVRRLADASELFVTRDAFPRCDAVLAGRDWDLLRALRKDPHRSYADLARETGVSARTAKSRLANILAQGVAFAWPTINMRSSLGGSFVQLEVRYAGDRKSEVDAAVCTEVEPYLWHVLPLLPYRRGDPWASDYNLAVPNLAAARQVADAVRDIPGVLDARAYLYEGIVNFFDVYDDALDRRLAGMPTARTAGSRDAAPRRARPG